MHIEELRIRTIEEANLHLAQLQGLIRDPGPSTPLQIMRQFNEFSYVCAEQSDSWVWQIKTFDVSAYVRVEDHARLNALIELEGESAAHIFIPTCIQGLPTVTIVERKVDSLEVQSLQVLLQTDNLQSLDIVPLLLPLRDTNWQLYLREKDEDTALSFLS
jgi:hypothetical protein